MKTGPFEFRRRRPVPGDVCLVIGFSFDVPGSISNLFRSVRVIKKVGGDVCMVRPTGERNLRGADERGTIHVPESWLLPLKPSSGSFAPVRPKPKIPSFAWKLSNSPIPTKIRSSPKNRRAGIEVETSKTIKEEHMLDENSEMSIALAMLDGALAHFAADSRPHINRELYSAGSVVRETCFYEFVLPRQCGKTFAIVNNVGPGDVVICMNGGTANALIAEIKSKGVEGVHVLTEDKFDHTVRAIAEIRSQGGEISHYYFFDEVSRALPIAREIGRTYYGRAFGSEDGGQLPGFFSLKT